MKNSGKYILYPTGFSLHTSAHSSCSILVNSKKTIRFFTAFHFVCHVGLAGGGGAFFVVSGFAAGLAAGLFCEKLQMPANIQLQQKQRLFCLYHIIINFFGKRKINFWKDLQKNKLDKRVKLSYKQGELCSLFQFFDLHHLNSGIAYIHNVKFVIGNDDPFFLLGDGFMVIDDIAG